MYSQSKVKQANVAAGVSGSLLCEIACGDIANFKQWRKEWKDTEFTLGYDQVFGKDWNLSLETAKDLETVKLCLKSINLEANYHLIKDELEKVGVNCGGYTDAGRLLTVYNNVAQLTIDCSKPTAPQLSAWKLKWC
jgi:hypothetical protein